MIYAEFKARYNILAAKLVAKAKNDKGAAGAVLEAIQLEKEKYRLGHTKVFFRAGILGFMEEVREDRIGQVLAWLQSGARGKSSRMQFKKLQDQKLALYCCQRTIRNYYIGKKWLWWQMWTAIKPNLKCTQFGKYKAEYEGKIAMAEANIDKAIADCNKVIAEHDRLLNEKNELDLALNSGGNAVQVILISYTFKLQFIKLCYLNCQYSRISSIKPTEWNPQEMTCKNKWIRPMQESEEKRRQLLEFSSLALRLLEKQPS